MTLHVPTARTVERIKDMVHRAEELPGKQPRPAHVPHATETHWVKITSTTKTAGRYPGQRYDLDPETRTWTAAEDCWVDVPNVEKLTTGVIYPAKLAGEADGRFVYYVTTIAFRYRYDCGGSGSSSGSGGA